MEVSKLRLARLTIAQHVFQPALTGRLELILRKIVSSEREQRLSQWAVSRKIVSRELVQGVTAISWKISRYLEPKNGVQHATAIYPIPRYTQPRYIGSTLYHKFWSGFSDWSDYFHVISSVFPSLCQCSNSICCSYPQSIRDQFKNMVYLRRTVKPLI